MKHEESARPLGVRRLRRAPQAGQKFEVAIDGRPVRARIVRLSTHAGATSDVFAEEF